MDVQALTVYSENSTGGFHNEPLNIESIRLGECAGGEALDASSIKVQHKVREDTLGLHGGLISASYTT